MYQFQEVKNPRQLVVEIASPSEFNIIPAARVDIGTVVQFRSRDLQIQGSHAPKTLPKLCQRELKSGKLSLCVELDVVLLFEEKFEELG